ncbi:putative coiled-coil domain-containing protein 195 [Tupaia chinensis]|uniref:putative coiled-coil domain-containing protein 195 n=1 Tax=Tupaia chinensis TaxID=246437 RepID=UPI000FFBFAFD|nr:putative coiled-coil domain-containing protein 195 [Tupaia chinensis]
METNIQLMRVIQEMRAEMNKLEKENQALRMKLISRSPKVSGSGGETGDEREEKAHGQSPATPHGVVSIEAEPAMPAHQDNVMIVRRYSVSSSGHSLAVNDPWKAEKLHPHCRILTAQGTVKSLACPSTKKQDNEGKMFTGESFVSNSSSQRISPEHVSGYRLEQLPKVSINSEIYFSSVAFQSQRTSSTVNHRAVNCRRNLDEVATTLAKISNLISTQIALCQ